MAEPATRSGGEMLDVRDRRGPAPTAVDLEWARDAEPFEPAWPGRVAVAVLSAGAGAIHLVMVPSHMAEYAPEGIGFAVAGWVQVLVAGVVLATGRPGRWLVRATTALQVALIGVWALSRTAGLPLGPHAGQAEEAGLVDLTCVALEAGLLVVCLVLLARPSIGRAWPSRRLAAASVIPFAVLAVTTAAIASPSARNHAHAGGHSHAAVGDDLGLGMLHNGQHAHIVQTKLDGATRKQLDAQLAVTRAVARQYPTLAAALAAGYRRAGPFSPGLGLHVVKPDIRGLNMDGIMSVDDLRHPLSIIYDGTAPSSPIAGFMYYSAKATPPVGFAGGNDFWHYHVNVCTKLAADGSIDAPFGADQSSAKGPCDAVGGFLMPKTQWMVHVWTAPAYEVGDADGGVFAEVNPQLRCPDGSYYRMPQRDWPTHLMNVCRSEL